jgi:DNA-directed RNA polymerase specialized sigma24 family protein
MNLALKIKPLNIDADDKVLKSLYERYASKLLAYTNKNYRINEDDAWSVVLTTVYKVAQNHSKYTFENNKKESSFVFKTHINFLRNYFRLNKVFEYKNVEVELREDFLSMENCDANSAEKPELKVLQNELEKLEEWQRVLLLMRGQEMPYSEIAKFVNKPEKQLKVYYGRLKTLLLERVNTQLEKISRNEKQN